MKYNNGDGLMENEDEIIAELRLIQFDTLPHPDFFGYGICEIYYDKRGEYIFHSPPVDLYALDYDDLRYTMEECTNALYKDCLLESELKKSTASIKFLTHFCTSGI